VDDKAIAGMKVINSSISSQLHWHFYAVEVSEEEIERLSHSIKDGWYAHFWNGNKVIVAFKDRIFRFDHDKKETWKPAVDYGLSLGIPTEQLDFPID
jgi:hypothetical protein